jgi:hypothetical protein
VIAVLVLPVVWRWWRGPHRGSTALG